MTDDRWQRVKALFQATVERPVGERDAFLASAAGDDVQGQGGFWKCGWALGLEPKLGGPKNGTWGEPSGLSTSTKSAPVAWYARPLSPDP